MERILRARFSDGAIIPLEDVDFAEGEEMTLVVSRSQKKQVKKADTIFDRTSGGWEGLVDAERLKKSIYEDREICTRPSPKL